jgi:tRNA(Glu) U13 pseudouridine synthase TruD
MSDMQCAQLSQRRHTTRGFINYFGLQRFGCLAPTHLIGKYLLKGEYDVAVALLLAPVANGNEKPEVVAAREYFVRTRDVLGAQRLFPRYMVVEQCLLRGLETNGLSVHELTTHNGHCLTHRFLFLLQVQTIL